MKQEIKINPKIQWAVVCLSSNRTSIHNTYEKAVAKKALLNQEYQGECKHKIVKVKVLIPKKLLT